MTKSIVIIGSTPLCQYLAEILDESLARLVHVDVRWLTTPGKIVPLSIHPTVLGASKPLKTPQLSHVRVGRVPIKSISLPDRRITTAKGVINYDWLLIDQGQAVTDEQLKVIRTEVKKLVASIQAAINTGEKKTAAITVNGRGAAAAELAVALRADLHKLPDVWRRIDLVCSDCKAAPSLRTALSQLGIRLSRTDKAGVTITTDLPIISNKKIRGLMIDRAGHAITDGSGRIDKFPEATFLDSDDRVWQNLLRFDRTLARKIAANFERLVEGESFRALELRGSATLLMADKPILQLGSLTSSGLRARAVRALEQRAFRQD